MSQVMYITSHVYPFHAARNTVLVTFCVLWFRKNYWNCKNREKSNKGWTVDRGLIKTGRVFFFCADFVFYSVASSTRKRQNRKNRTDWYSTNSSVTIYEPVTWKANWIVSDDAWILFFGWLKGGKSVWPGETLTGQWVVCWSVFETRMEHSGNQTTKEWGCVNLPIEAEHMVNPNPSGE